MKDDGVHNYIFGQIPEMPWKKEEIKMEKKESNTVELSADAITSVKTIYVHDVPYEIKFVHVKPKLYFPKLRNKKVKYGTLCVIYPQIRYDMIYSEWNALVMFVGKTRLHPNDHYDNRFGEKETLKRAMARGMPREIKKLIWQAWFDSYSGGYTDEQME